MSFYSVPIVDRSLLQLWEEYHGRKVPSPAAVEANRGGALNNTVHVEASNAEEAAAEAERTNPGCVAVRHAVKEHV